MYSMQIRALAFEGVGLRDGPAGGLAGPPGLATHTGRAHRVGNVGSSVGLLSSEITGSTLTANAGNFRWATCRAVPPGYREAHFFLRLQRWERVAALKSWLTSLMISPDPCLQRSIAS